MINHYWHYILNNFSYAIMQFKKNFNTVNSEIQVLYTHLVIVQIFFYLQFFT